MTIQPIILAGGSGTRLWPASRQSHPKQLFALTGPYSFLQEIALRLQGFAPAAPAASGAPAGPAAATIAVADPIVVTNEDYRFMVADQLREGDVVLEDTRGTLVHADYRLVTVLGTDDLVVVETADVVLVAPRNKTAHLKKLMARAQKGDAELTVHRRRVHRPWGRFDSVDSGERFQVKRIVVSPGATLSLQLHKRRAEHRVVVRGEAEVTCGDKVLRLKEDESTYVPVNTAHRLHNPGPEPLEIIEVPSGDYLGEDDIVRLHDRYGRLEP